MLTRLSERERVWTNCFNWIAGLKNVNNVTVHRKSCVVKFRYKDEPWKVFVPIEDKLSVVALNEFTQEWKEVFSKKELKKLIKSE